MVTSDSAAFDAFAGDYDTAFTHSRLGQLLRPRVWAKLAQFFAPGQHVLELACGTGEDALWLAQRGVRVTATDGSAEMVRVAQAKAGPAGVVVKQLSLQQLLVGENPLGESEPGAGLRPSARKGIKAGFPPFDGAYSNFGGLNTINAWPILAARLAKLIKPGSALVLVPMGPFCPWEIGWYAGHGQLKTAFRRFRSSAPAKIGDKLIPIWYPSARRLQTAFRPWFDHLQTESLGLWLPPSYLDHFVNHWPSLFAYLDRFEQQTARLTGGWGDHYIIVLKRKNKT
jgi:SAM-dependent methyltransferase